MVRFRHVILNQKVIHTKLLSLRKRIYPAQHSPILIELPCFHPHHFSQQHLLYDFLHFLPELFHLALASFGGIDARKSEGESGVFSVEEEGNLDGVSISDMKNFA